MVNDVHTYSRISNSLHVFRRVSFITMYTSFMNHISYLVVHSMSFSIRKRERTEPNPTGHAFKKGEIAWHQVKKVSPIFPDDYESVLIVGVHMENTEHEDALCNVYYTVQYTADTTREKQCMWDTLREKCILQDADMPQVYSTSQCTHVDGIREAEEKEENLFL